jgi:predicted acetyltransferase
MNIKFIRCKWEDVQPLVLSYFKENRINTDTYSEGFLIYNNHYLMTCGNETAGYFAINRKNTISLFHVFPYYANQAQELFARIKKYEEVAGAMVLTGDEFFLSHCLDSFVRIEREQYNAVYTDKDMPNKRNITLRRADYENEDDKTKLRLDGGTFHSGAITAYEEGRKHMHLYIAEDDGEYVGYGLIDDSVIFDDKKSIGMYVLEDKREQGYGSSILHSMRDIVREMGYEVDSACAPDNNNSKKSLERSGAYFPSRLVKFYF